LGLNFGNISIEGFALMINDRKGILSSDLQLQFVHFFHNSPIFFFQLFFDGSKSFSTFGLKAMEALLYKQSMFIVLVDWEESRSSQLLSSKPLEKFIMVALRVVVYESTSKLTLATGLWFTYLVATSK
jgi:hypothetical protein